MKVRGATRRLALDEETPSVIAADCARLRAATEAEFAELGLTGPLEPSLELDMRFIGQAFEIPVTVDPARVGGLSAADLAERFAEEHRRVYLHGGEPGRKVELVGLRFGLRRRLDALPEVRERAAELARPATAEVVTGGATVQARLADAATLGIGEVVQGPALIEGYSSTTWVPPGWSGARDAAGNMLLRKEG